MARLARSLTAVAALIVLAAVAAQATQLFTATQAQSAAFASGTRQWELLGRSRHHHLTQLVFAIKQKHTDMLKTMIDEVSNPASPSYTQYFTFEEIGALFRHDGNVKVVRAFLEDNGVTDVTETRNGEFVVTKLTVGEAEKLLGENVAQFYTFRNRQTNTTAYRTPSFTLPDDVAAAVDFVGNTIHLSTLSRLGVHSFSSEAVGAKNPGDVYPSVLQNYYNIPTTVANPASGNVMSVFEALGQSYAPNDLASFDSLYGVSDTPVAKVIGPNTPFSCALNPNNCVEASLDVEYINAVAQGLPLWFWSIASNSQDPFLDWVVALSDSSNPPYVHSISYGGDESEEPYANAARFDQEIQKLGLRGVSVFIASGDDGVAGADARSDPSACGFNPSFPATSAYVTAVGATQGPEDNKVEVACTSDTGGGITSGGGFSNYFAQPSYQTVLVNKYLNSGVTLPPTNLFNYTGRGYPDVAMLGHNYEIYVDKQIGVGSGTSASTPVFAGIVALTNNARIAAGKQPLGFLNPALYQAKDTNPSIFHEITSGNNRCCAGPTPDCCQYGFNAEKGWNPVTGLGSVDYQAFLQYFSNL